MTFFVGLVLDFSFQFSLSCLKNWDLNRASQNEITIHHGNEFFFHYLIHFFSKMFSIAFAFCSSWWQNEDESFNFFRFKNQVNFFQFWGWVVCKCVMHFTQFTTIKTFWVRWSQQSTFQRSEKQKMIIRKIIVFI